MRSYKGVRHDRGLRVRGQRSSQLVEEEGCWCLTRSSYGKPKKQKEGRTKELVNNGHPGKNRKSYNSQDPWQAARIEPEVELVKRYVSGIRGKSGSP